MCGEVHQSESLLPMDRRAPPSPTVRRCRSPIIITTRTWSWSCGAARNLLNRLQPRLAHVLGLPRTPRGISANSCCQRSISVVHVTAGPPDEGSVTW